MARVEALSALQYEALQHEALACNLGRATLDVASTQQSPVAMRVVAVPLSSAEVVDNTKPIAESWSPAGCKRFDDQLSPQACF